ncbi:MAG: DEAD/DEAH box helicase family protein [archaeon]|nr:DEAD/DEAH box helicase family protein [archaeon]
MTNEFLFKKLERCFGKRNINEKEVDEVIINNLHDRFKLRYYQEEAFKIFQVLFEDGTEFKKFPLSLLFHMATGSGKTLIMAGLILYLYKNGYNNFLFFVNTTDIIEKTKDNFLNKSSIKYLFNEKIVINNKNINIKEVVNFEGTNPNDINICFTTIQKLHSDLNTEKENSITYEEFKNKKIVLISDESHHIQTKTKQTKLDAASWENTIEYIHKVNTKNILLEFTATPGYQKNEDIKQKYLDRLIYKYDLKKFVKDKYSKNIDILKIDINNLRYLMLVAIIINQYRQDIANKHGINLKPVLMFKASKEIKDSHMNNTIFNSLINELDVKHINDIKNRTKSNFILSKIFDFYQEEGISCSNLVKKLKISFAEENCFNVNENNLDKKSLKVQDRNELLYQQNVLNTLEDKNNNIRVIFAVNKLNEGWDVLNLYDIVRVSSNQSTSKTKKSRTAPSKTTISEAQLIGRGSRYYPFLNVDSEDKYKRKFDDDINNELKILEDLYYYSYNESNYILELKNALKNEGFSLSEDKEKRHLKLKDSFKESKFYKRGKIFINKREDNGTVNINSFPEELDESIQNFHYELRSGKIEVLKGLSEDDINNDFDKKYLEIKLRDKDIQTHVIRNALSKINFFSFNNLKKYFPINSIDEFIEDSKYLGELSITFHGTSNDLDNLTNSQKFEAICSLLSKLEKTLQKKIVHYKGSTEFEDHLISDIFYDKELHIPKNDLERLNGQKELIKRCDWYVFDANYGTSEEMACVEFIDSIISNLEERFEEIYFVRNERHFKIYNFRDGESFEPDFILFLKDNKNNLLNYQLFIEPKGEHLLEGNKWKEEFLKEINEKAKIAPKIVETEEFKIHGLPFYNSSKELKFKKELYELLELDQ